MHRHLLLLTPLLGLLAICQSPLSLATELPGRPLSPTPEKPAVNSPSPKAPRAKDAAAAKRQKAGDVPLHYRGRMVNRRGMPLHERVIALTFDDGPNAALTPLVLKALAQYNARATFFVMGQWVQEHPELVAQEAAAGHAVESHSYSHPTEDVNTPHARRELERAATIIEQIAGAKPRLFRPPYGNINWNMSKVAAKEGYCVVKWTVCGSDSPSETPAEIVENVLRSPQPGDIVLLHDGRCHNNTARALPEILRRLSAKGYRFVTVPQLLRLWDAAQRPATTTNKSRNSRRARAV